MYSTPFDLPSPAHDFIQVGKDTSIAMIACGLNQNVFEDIYAREHELFQQNTELCRHLQFRNLELFAAQHLIASLRTELDDARRLSCILKNELDEAKIGCAKLAASKSSLATEISKLNSAHKAHVANDIIQRAEISKLHAAHTTYLAVDAALRGELAFVRDEFQKYVARDDERVNLSYRIWGATDAENEEGILDKPASPVVISDQEFVSPEEQPLTISTVIREMGYDCRNVSLNCIGMFVNRAYVATYGRKPVLHEYYTTTPNKTVVQRFSHYTEGDRELIMTVVREHGFRLAAGVLQN